MLLHAHSQLCPREGDVPGLAAVEDGICHPRTGGATIVVLSRPAAAHPLTLYLLEPSALLVS